MLIQRQYNKLILLENQEKMQEYFFIIEEVKVKVLIQQY